MSELDLEAIKARHRPGTDWRDCFDSDEIGELIAEIERLRIEATVYTAHNAMLRHEVDELRARIDDEPVEADCGE